MQGLLRGQEGAVAGCVLPGAWRPARRCCGCPWRQRLSLAFDSCSFTSHRPSNTSHRPSPQVFKLKFLLPYLDRLLRLADNKTLRGELTAFPLAARWVL